MVSIHHIVIIGSGNTAGFLGSALVKRGYKIDAVISRNIDTGNRLATRLNTIFTTDTSIISEADIVFVCTSDDNIAEVSAQLPATGALVCHCAGSISIEALKQQRKGVFYPLQTLRNDGDITLPDECPFLVEASVKADEALLCNLAVSLGYTAATADSRQRMVYHLAAVFANNFTNAMLLASEEITEKQHLNFSLLQPLIHQTVQKLGHGSHFKQQTGPARRGDKGTLNLHRNLIDDTVMRDMYDAISAFIARKFGH